MRQFLFLLFFLAVLITTGCVSDDTTSAPVLPAQTILASLLTANSSTPVLTTEPAPEPAEMAYLENVNCAVIEERVTTYRCMGKVRIKSGIYSEVQVIAIYPDKNTFDSGIAAMGGSDPVLKPFILFPDLKYRDQNPLYFVKLDNTRYPVIMNGSSGIAYVNPPPTEAVITTGPVVTTIATASGRPATTITTIPGSVPTIRWISPAIGSPDRQQILINGSDFRQYPPPEVYFRKQGSPCEYCGVHATNVEYLNPTEIRCYVDMRGPEAGPASYDVLVTNSYLADSYGILPNGLRIE